MPVLNVQINIRDIKVYYMEDDGGSPFTNGVSRDIKAAVRKVIQYLESAHGIKGQKVSLQKKTSSQSTSLAYIISILSAIITFSSSISVIIFFFYLVDQNSKFSRGKTSIHHFTMSTYPHNMQ